MEIPSASFFLPSIFLPHCVCAPGTPFVQRTCLCSPHRLVSAVRKLNFYERIDCRFDGVGFHQNSKGGKSALAGRVGQPRGGGGEFFQSGQNDRRRRRRFSEALPAALSPARH